MQAKLAIMDVISHVHHVEEIRFWWWSLDKGYLYRWRVYFLPTHREFIELVKVLA